MYEQWRREAIMLLWKKKKKKGHIVFILNCLRISAQLPMSDLLTSESQNGKGKVVLVLN
jgi:hypothetical protein